MLPKQYEYLDGRLVKETPAFGKAYRLSSEGDPELLWETSGWYAYKHDLYLSRDGQFLVRIGHFATAYTPYDQDLGVAFYDNGLEINRYSIKELVKSRPLPNPTGEAPGFFLSNPGNFVLWEGGLPRINYYDEFEIKTIDGMLHTFNITTGELIHPEIVKLNEIDRNKMVIYEPDTVIDEE
ncbi:MAG: hypothetical protein R3F02_17670 [Thiolinea sp.]